MLAEDREELKLALQRLRITDDGKTLFAFLEHALFECLGPNQPDGALREENGRRNFARELLLLSQGPVNERRPESEASADRSDSGRGPVAFGPVRPRGVTRRVGTEARKS